MVVLGSMVRAVRGAAESAVDTRMCADRQLPVRHRLREEGQKVVHAADADDEGAAAVGAHQLEVSQVIGVGLVVVQKEARAGAEVAQSGHRIAPHRVDEQKGRQCDASLVVRAVSHHPSNPAHRGVEHRRGHRHDEVD